MTFRSEMKVESVSFDLKYPKARFVVLDGGRRITLSLEWIGEPLKPPSSWRVSLEGEIANAKAERQLKNWGRFVPYT